MFSKNILAKCLFKGVAFFLHVWYYIKDLFLAQKLICIFLYNKSRRICFSSCSERFFMDIFDNNFKGVDIEVLEIEAPEKAVFTEERTAKKRKFSFIKAVSQRTRRYGTLLPLFILFQRIYGYHHGIKRL